MNLNGSVFLKVTSIDEATRRVTCELGEQPDHLSRALDYAASKANFAAMKGQELFEMGKSTAVGKISDVECDDVKKRFFVTAQIGNAVAWTKVKSGTYPGMQCRVYADDALKADAVSYAGAPGAMSLVDRPFDNATELRKSREKLDPADALRAGLNKAFAVMAKVETSRTFDLRGVDSRLAKMETADGVRSLRVTSREDC
jgi:hypothetical protein